MTFPAKRFFYTDPLAAAWMAKHFEMRFSNREGAEIAYTTGYSAKTILYGWEFVGGGGYCGEQWTIHPDSLHLLEPKAGDLVVTPDKEAGIVTESNPSGGLDFGRWFSVGEQGLSNIDNHKIVQRNGIAFMWPESEDA